MDRKIKLPDLFSQRGIPSIHISPTHVEVVGGQSHTITCSVSSISVITDVTWIKTTADGDEIVNVIGVDGKFSGGTLSNPSLTINNIAKSDEGTYVCRATHRLGTTSSKHSVLTCKDNPFPVQTINQGRTNYARLGLVVVDIFPNILREVTHNNIQPDVLNRQIRKQRKNNPSVFDRMTHEERVSLNTLTSSTYDNIDFITLYKLMRSFSLLNDPKQGWGQSPTNADVTISDDVERLRFARNKIVHRIKADINLIETRKCFSNIVNITQRIDTYLGKLPYQGFTREVLNFQTCCMDAETEQKYYQALKDIEDIKEKFSEGNVHIYYGKSFSNLIQDVKNKAKSSVIPISLVLEDINDGEKQRMMNELKTEINSGLVNIKFKQAVSGSLIIYIDILDSNLLSTEHELGHQIYNFLCRALQLTRFNMKTENEITVVLIKEEDDIEVEFSIESDNWKTYDEEINLRSNSLCLELDVNTEIFNTEQKMQSEFCLLVKSVLGSNGKSNIESVSARLEPGIVEQNPCSLLHHERGDYTRELDKSFRDLEYNFRKLVETFRNLVETFRKLEYNFRPPHERDDNTGKLEYNFREMERKFGELEEICRRLRYRKLEYNFRPPHERDDNTGKLEYNFREMEHNFREMDDICRKMEHNFLLDHERVDNTGDLEYNFRELRKICQRLRYQLLCYRPPRERGPHQRPPRERGPHQREMERKFGEMEDIWREMEDICRRLRYRVSSAELKLHTKGPNVTLKDIGKTESKKPVAVWHTVPPASSPPNPPI